MAGMDARRLLARVEELAVKHKASRKLPELKPLHRAVLASAQAYSEKGRAISYRALARKHGLTVWQVDSILGVIRRHGYLPEKWGWRKEVSTDCEQRKVLYANHARLLKNRVSHYCAVHPEAREAVGAAVEAAFDACTLHFNPAAGRFSTYFYRAAANRVKRVLSRSSRPPRGAPEATAWEDDRIVPAAVDDAARGEALQAVGKLLDVHRQGLLSERWLLAFLLFHYGGLKKSEVGAALGVGRERGRQLVRNATERVSRVMQQQPPAKGF